MLYTRENISSADLKKGYKRIISLVPSQTELLHDLGLNREVVGITSFCIHPKSWFKSKTRIGGTKRIHFDRIDDLNPDLIIANKEENEKDQIEELAKKYPVWLTDVNDLHGALAMIDDIGTLTNTQNIAAGIVKNIESGFSSLQMYADSVRKATIAYFIWQNPYMVAAKDTFIDDMIMRCGLVNAFPRVTRYPVLEEDELQGAAIDYVFLSSEPYPFADKHIPAFEKLFPQSKIVLVDGEMFSWYGSRLQQAPEYFKKLLGKL